MEKQRIEQVEIFKNNLINSLHNIQKETKTETIRIDKLITLIQNTK